jgi:RNA polymerase sigma-70 factor (ECF subfamily)
MNPISPFVDPEVSPKDSDLAGVPAFDDLFREYRPLVYGIALRFLGNAADAEDVAQEVFTKVWRNLASFQCQSSVKTWIYRISINACIDYRRKRWAKPSQPEEVLELGTETTEPALTVEESAERRLLAQERAVQVRRAIKRLKPHLKSVLVLKDLEEMSYDEISSSLGLSMGTISSRLNRARKAFLQAFESLTPALAQQ